VVESPVLKGAALGVLLPVIRKKVSCWDSVLRMLARGRTRGASVVARVEMREMMTPMEALVMTREC
jgi:hypothetical protein